MKSGFVTLAGRSNVGKSTLLNALIGTKVAIVTPKPQTTRHPVRGILNDPRGQIVFVDTPGLFLGKKDRVSARLNRLVEEQIEGVDAIVYVMDPTREPGAEEERIRTLLSNLKTPVIAVVNKMDVDEQARPWTETMRRTDVGQRETIALSAKTHADVNRLVDSLFGLLPDQAPFYPQGQMTDLSHREWLAEIIREKAFLKLGQELPYTIHVTIDDVETDDQRERVEATVWTTDERYKKMVIGAGARMVKAIGAEARKEIQSAMGKNIRLDLTVNVDSKWPERFH